MNSKDGRTAADRLKEQGVEIWHLAAKLGQESIEYGRVRRATVALLDIASEALLAASEAVRLDLE